MEEFPIVFTMSILVLFDVMVMTKFYFLRIILYLVFTVFWLKDNDFGVYWSNRHSHVQ